MALFAVGCMGRNLMRSPWPVPPQDGSYDLSAPPPFGLSDIRNAIPGGGMQGVQGRGPDAGGCTAWPALHPPALATAHRAHPGLPVRARLAAHCWEKNAWKSIGYLVRDVAIVAGLAAGALAINSW